MAKSPFLNDGINLIAQALEDLRHCNVRSNPMRPEVHERICRTFEAGLAQLVTLKQEFS